MSKWNQVKTFVWISRQGKEKNTKKGRLRMNTLKLSDTYRVSLSMGKKKIGFRSNLFSSRETGHFRKSSTHLVLNTVSNMYLHKILILEKTVKIRYCRNSWQNSRASCETCYRFLFFICHACVALTNRYGILLPFPMKIKFEIFTFFWLCCF